jgi:hypothetical protein
MKRDRSNAPAVRVTAVAKARLDEIRSLLLPRVVSYAQLVDELARDRLAELKAVHGGEWVHPHRLNGSLAAERPQTREIHRANGHSSNGNGKA